MNSKKCDYCNRTPTKFYHLKTTLFNRPRENYMARCDIHYLPRSKEYITIMGTSASPVEGMWEINLEEYEAAEVLEK